MSDISERIANLPLEKRRLLELLLLEQATPPPEARAPGPSRRGSSSAPLSFAQQRFWFFHQAAPLSGIHNLSGVLRLKGALRLHALEGSLRALLLRHEALRTVFPDADGRPRQLIVAPPVEVLSVTDLTGLPRPARETEALRLAADEGRRPFDLARGPLLRARLLRLDDREHVLVLTTHHIVSDGWSQGIIIREIAEHYRAFSDGTPPRPPALPIQYSDYALWEREWLAGEAVESHLAYWRRALDGVVGLELPFDRPRPAAQGFRSTTETFELSESLTKSLRALGRREGATLFMTLLAAFKVLLHFYTGQEDLSVGSAVANRTRKELENLVGCFLNLVVLRTSLSGDPTIRQLLGRVGEVCLEAFAHAEVPFQRVVQELQLERGLNRNPLFRATFVLINAPSHDSALPGLSMDTVETEQGLAENDLNLMLFEERERLNGRLTCNADLFDPATVGRLLGHWLRVLEGMVADPGQRLSDLSPLSEAELKQILLGWNETQTPSEPAGCVHELFEAQARQAPERLAITCGPDQLTYGELNRLANRLARYLQSLNVGPEVCVGVFMERSLEMVLGQLAVLKAGGAFVPLDPTYPAQRLAFMIEDARAEVLLTKSELRAKLPGAGAKVVCLDTDWGEIAAAVEGNPESGVLPGNLAYVIYTSGSTGRPKGVEIRHETLVNLTGWHRREFQLTPDDRAAVYASPGFDASVWEIWPNLAAGASLHVPAVEAHVNPAQLAEWTVEQAITTRFLSTAVAEIFVELNLPETLPLRLLHTGGDKLRKHPRRRPPFRFVNLYGPTENTVCATLYDVEPGEAEAPPPIGRPIGNVQVYVLDRRLRPVPVGVPGELCLGGRSLSRGYRNHPALTAEKFVPHPFGETPGARLYKTGDLVKFLPDGNLDFLGRIDEQVKIRGYRIETGEVEAALLQHPCVEQAVVLCREDRPGDRRLVAYVVPKPDAPRHAPEQVRDFLRQRLPDYMLPSAFVTLEEMPLTRSDKIDRRALPPPDARRPRLASGFAPPAGRAEQLLAEVWAQVLGVEGVGVHDSFFDLGGDSIRSIEVCARARKAGLDISIQQLFQHQTISELARVAGNPETPSPDDAAATGPFDLISEQDRRGLPPGVEAAYPLTRMQAGMLFHSEYTPEANTYHDIFSLHLRGACDPEVLRSVVRELVARQDVLRTSFDLTSYAEALQLVHREVELPFEVEDLRHLPSAEQECAVRRRLEAEKVRRFDWARAPLLRLLIQLRGENSYQLTLSFHHAVLDGWSLASMLTGIFNDYLSALKGAGRESAPPLRAAFRDYVALELAALRSEEQRDYWKRKLEGGTSIKLPRRPASRPAKDAAEVRELLLPLRGEQSEGLRAVAKAEGVPLKSVLLAAHLRVLSFLGAQADVLTGLVSNGRPETTDAERLLGLFLNTLPFRLKLKGGSWGDLVRETFAAEREMLAFRRYPLDEIQKAQSGGEPLFETCFNFTHFHVFKGLQDGGEIQVLDSTSHAETNFALLTSFDVDDASSEIRLGLNYNSPDLRDEQAEAIGRYYLAVLRAMADDRHARYELHSPLSADERRRLLVEWNETERVDAREEPLHARFEARAARTPDSVALVFGETRWTYAGLNRRANRAAHYLRARGVGPEVRVGILTERTPEMVCGILGVLKAGGAYVPLDPAYPQERLSFMLEDSGAAVLLTQQSLSDKLPRHNARVVCLDAPGDSLGRQSEENPALALAPRNLAYVIYTSGSTGRPKGIAIEHRSAAVFLAWVEATFSERELAGVLFSTSVCFDLSVFELFAPLGAGGKIILAENALRLPSLSSADEVTLINLVPSALSALLEVDGIPASVETVNLAGEPLALGLVRRTYERRHVRRVFNLYGPSEDTTYSTGVLLDRESDAPPPIGRPVANTQTYLLDGHLLPVPEGTQGLLYIGGEGLARCYFNDARQTAERFIPDPFSAAPGRRLYETGDVASHLPDGNLRFVGRADHQVKVRGFRIELGEIEAALKQHPSVRQAVVSALDDGSGERRLVAHLVFGDARPQAAQDLHDFLRAKLPGYMIPSAFVPLEKLPLTPNGKINRAALPTPERDAAEPDDAATLPRDTLELKLMRIWEELLGRSPIGLRDNFFLDLGGHSILAVRLAARIEKRLGVRLSLSTLIQGPTIEQLALALRREAVAEPATPLVAINPNGSRPPFFCVHPATGNALCYVHLARHLGGEQPFYGLQAAGLDGEAAPLDSVEDMARSYVAALRTVQPSGPYFLGGHSFGGIVAYEMACQLKRSGHEVALLAILDTMAPSHQTGSPPEEEQADDARWLCDIIRVFERFLNRDLSVNYEELRPLGPDEQLSFVLERLKEIDLFSRDAGAEQLRGLLQVEKSNIRAVRRYVPQRYPGEITLFRAAELQQEDSINLPPDTYLNRSLGWEALSPEPVVTHTVPGDHITMITEAHASALAAQLRTHLERPGRQS
jgi:amino acid adenylation domain-containing protein